MHPHKRRQARADARAAKEAGRVDTPPEVAPEPELEAAPASIEGEPNDDTDDTRETDPEAGEL